MQDIRTISTDPSYHGWGTVAARRNDELLVACSGGRQEHVCPYGKVFLYRSADGGETWGGPQVVADTPLDDRDSGVLETSKGTILVNWFTSLTWQNYLYRQETGQIDWIPRETQLKWRRERERIADTVKVRDFMGDWLVRSTDGGRTWSPRVPTVVNSPHGMIEASDGSLLYAGKRTSAPQGWQRGSPHESGENGVARSLDDGASWQWLGAIPCADGHAPADYHELHAVEVGAGRFIAQIRNHGQPFPGETLQTESRDGGVTWTKPHSIGVWGTPSHLMKLRDGRVLMTYGYRQKPFGNQARVSDDRGTTWSAPFTISADGCDADLGYPSSAQLSDGTIVTVWYERFKDSPAAVLRQARWRLAE